jgi:hypothetical protein
MKAIFENVGGLDAAKWGVSDFYEEHEKALRSALASGEDFTTEAYAVKKEIQTGEVSRVNGEICCRVWVTDDFDTEGECGISFIPDPDMTPADLYDKIIESLNEALEGAQENKNENEIYIGYSIGHPGANPDIPEHRADWIWTYVQRRPGTVGEDMLDDEDPSEYYAWGWNYGGIHGEDSEEDRITPEDREAMERWAKAYAAGEIEKNNARIGDWVISPWH